MNRATRRLKPYPNTVQDDGSFVPNQHLWNRQLKALAKWMLVAITALFMAAVTVGVYA
jgi:hypothetical protein